MNRSPAAVDLDARTSAPGRDVSRREARFLVLANDHLDAAYRLARAILRDSLDAQDATHDAFVQAWQKWETLRDPDRFEAWFGRILVNSCRNRLRARRWHATDISSEVALVSADRTGEAENRQLVGAAIASLSPDHQVVVALRYYRDLTVADIAARLGIPHGTVQSRLHYALRALQAAIEPADAQGSDR